MAKKPVCLVCQKAMEPGFIPDLGMEIRIPRWCAGTPDNSSMLGEATAAQYDKGLKVVAYRCPECEALRLYAPSTQAKT